MKVSTTESAISKSPRCESPPLLTPEELAPLTVTEGRLCGTVRPVADLPPCQREEMFRLLEGNFDNTSRERFEADLAEKHWAILLQERMGGALQGFSTLIRLDDQLHGRDISAFFSGDTVISREYWGETVLPRLWSMLVFRLAEKLKERSVYWFLICSGYKTYRFLPVFFRDFYPAHHLEVPGEIRQVMDRLAGRKFPGEYDPALGVVRFREATPLKAGLAEVTEQRLRDPHVSFFHRVNPGHVLGDELVCLTEVRHDNLTPAGRRMLGLGRGPAS